MDPTRINLTDVNITTDEYNEYNDIITLKMYVHKSIYNTNPIYIIQINDIEINNLADIQFTPIDSAYLDYTAYTVYINCPKLIDPGFDDNTLDINIANKITLSTTINNNDSINTEYILPEFKNYSVYS